MAVLLPRKRPSRAGVRRNRLTACGRGDGTGPGFEVYGRGLVLGESFSIEAIDQNVSFGGALLQDQLPILAPGRALRPVAAIGLRNRGQRARSDGEYLDVSQHATIVGIGF